MEVALDDAAYPEIIWTFNALVPKPAPSLLERLAPGIDRGRVSLYAGIDCNSLFPQLLHKWHAIEPPVHRFAPPPKSNLLHPFIDTSELAQLIASGGRRSVEARVIEGDEEDRPPVADVYVGRELQLTRIASSDHRIYFITGIGGQGKSTLVAQYFALAQREHRFDYYVWRVTVKKKVSALRIN